MEISTANEEVSSNPTKGAVENSSDRTHSSKRRRLLQKLQAPDPFYPYTIDTVNFVSFLDSRTPYPIDENALFMKYCVNMGVDPFDDTKKPIDIWRLRRTLRPTARVPLSTTFLCENISSTLPHSIHPVYPWRKLHELYPATDKRRKASNAFIKAFNTIGDAEVFRKMITKYLTPDCEWENRYIGRQNPYGPMSVRLEGTEAIVKYYDTAARLAPDLVSHFQASDMILTPDGSAVMVSQTCTLGTKVFRTQTEDYQHVIVNKDGQAVGAPLSSATSTPAESSHSGHNNPTVNLSEEHHHVAAAAAAVETMAVEEKTEDELQELAHRLQAVDIVERVLVPGQTEVQFAALNLVLGYIHPSNPPSERAGKTYRVVVLHTAAVSSTTS